MKTIDATEAKTKFDVILDNIEKESFTIEKDGRPLAIVLSPEALEDYYWVIRAELAEEDGFMSADESEKFLKELREKTKKTFFEKIAD